METTSQNETQSGARREAERQAEIQKNLQDLSSRDPRDRSRAAERLGQLRAGETQLLAALKDPNAFVRASAAEALGHAASEKKAEAIEWLMYAIDDQNDYVTAAAVNSLGFLRADEARDQIAELLGYTNPNVVKAAILALSRLGPPALAERLSPFLDSQNPSLRTTAARAMGILKYTPAKRKVLAMLEASYQATNPRDQNEAKVCTETLAHLKAEEAIPLLTKIAQQQVGLRTVAVNALLDLNAESVAPLLAPLLRDPSANLRLNLIKMMRRADYRAALPYVRPLLQDASSQIRNAALATVSAWKDTGATEQVRWMSYHDPDPFLRPRAISALTTLLKAESLPDLLTLSNDTNAQVRGSVAANLGRLEPLPEEAMAVLQQMISDPQVANVARTVQATVDRERAMAPSTSFPKTPSPVAYINESFDAASTLASLEHWQGALAIQTNIKSDETLEIERALTTLIVALRKQHD